MSTHRIGVVADTHCPEYLEALPPGLARALEGVEIILHGGDVGGVETLATLQRIAPVQAVRGDHDRGLDLPARRAVEVGGVTIGLLHGNRGHLIEEPLTLLNTFAFGHLSLRSGLFGWLPRQFPGADVIVYGHTHAPDIRMAGSTLLFNPGAVYQVTPAMALSRLRREPGWFSWTWLQVMRHRRRWPPPSVGILEIVDGRVKASIIPLQ